MTPFVVIVTGSRDHTGRDLIEGRLEALRAECEANGRRLVVVHGHCPTGADAIAHAWCERNGVDVKPYPADWDGPCRMECHHGRRRQRPDGSTYCQAAGNYRSQAMVDVHSDAGRMEAFPLGESSGTWDAIERAAAAGIPVLKDGVELAPRFPLPPTLPFAGGGS